MRQFEQLVIRQRYTPIKQTLWSASVTATGRMHRMNEYTLP